MMWKCQSCFGLIGELICDHCAKSCHRGHALEPMGVQTSYCKCGVRCTVKRAVEPAVERPMTSAGARPDGRASRAHMRPLRAKFPSRLRARSGAAVEVTRPIKSRGQNRVKTGRLTPPRVL
jgi:hypothetical protein